MPKITARPTYTLRATETSFVEGSCGRRPMITMSNSSTETVTTIVVHQTQVGTSMCANLSGDADGSSGCRTTNPEVSPARLTRTNGTGTGSEPVTVMTTPLRRNTPLHRSQSRRAGPPPASRGPLARPTLAVMRASSRTTRSWLVVVVLTLVASLG